MFLVAYRRDDRRISRFCRPVDRSYRLYTVGTIWFVSLGNVRFQRRGIVVDYRRIQTQRAEDQAFDCFLEWQPCLFLDDQSEQIVGRMLLMQKLRARLEEQWLSLDF